MSLCHLISHLHPPRRQSDGGDVCSLLHDGANDIPEGVGQVELVLQLLWFLDARVRVVPLEGRESRQHPEEQRDANNSCLKDISETQAGTGLGEWELVGNQQNFCLSAESRKRSSGNSTSAELPKEPKEPLPDKRVSFGKHSLFLQALNHSICIS